MQGTRQAILEILRDRKQATIAQIVQDLSQRRGAITAVTVRHHLNHLQKEKLVLTRETIQIKQPGRPQHVYALTSQAEQQFPNNHAEVLSHLLGRLGTYLPDQQVNVIIEDVADRIAAQAHIPQVSLEQKLNHVVNFLNEQGYEANWSHHPEGYALNTFNCPYHQLNDPDHKMCTLDMRLIASLLGVVPRMIGHKGSGDASCSYLIPATG